MAKVLSLGFDAFAGDLYWVGALQYFNSPSRVLARECYPQLKDYLALSTVLAPEFVSAYRMAGAAIPCKMASGWRFLDEANAILGNGLQHFPEDWFLGLLYSQNLALQKRFGEAARVMAQAAKQPGAPPHLAGLATRLMATTGSTEGALLIAEDLLATVVDDEAREALRDRVRKIRHVRELERLRAALLRYREERGRWPAHLEDVAAERFVEAVPDDPLGGRWIYDAATGQLDASVPTPRITIFDPESR